MIDPGLLAEFADANIAGNLHLDEEFLQAMNDKDVHRIMACFFCSSDLVVVLHDRVLRGPDALRRFLAAWVTDIRTIRLNIDEVSRWLVGETAFAVGAATWELEHRDGAATVFKACWTDARRTVANRWLYVLNHPAEIQPSTIRPVMYSPSRTVAAGHGSYLRRPPPKRAVPYPDTRRL